jgi:predicted ABC-type ATPase
VPVPTIFAGPNGSGKSSLIRQVEFEGRSNLLEPDAIARRIKSGNSATTTLAGRWTNSAIGAALERLFFTRLFYICLDNPERSIQRVRERVAQGGPDVPDADVRRRYTRSLKNASHVLQ